MTSSTTPTAYAVSPDSGEHWTAEGAWQVAEGIHRIPLPLPMDGLKAINVYVIATDDGLVLIDGGWAIPEARELLDRCLRSIGVRLRRHPAVPGHPHPPRPLHDGDRAGPRARRRRRARHRREAGARPVPPRVRRCRARTRSLACSSPPAPPTSPSCGTRAASDQDARPRRLWQYPDTWLEGDHAIPVGARTLDAVHTPGHTPGHYVFADQADGLLFAGDHVLPTITPSIGFTVPPTPQPLGDFMASLTKVRALPDLQDPARPRAGRAVLARPRRRAAGLPRAAARAVARRARRRAAHLDAGRRPPGLDPPRARLRRPRRASAGAWPRWRPRPTSSCSSPAARPPGPRTPTGSSPSLP